MTLSDGDLGVLDFTAMETAKVVEKGHRDASTMETTMSVSAAALAARGPEAARLAAVTKRCATGLASTASAIEALSSTPIANKTRAARSGAAAASSSAAAASSSAADAAASDLAATGDGQPAEVSKPAGTSSGKNRTMTMKEKEQPFKKKQKEDKFAIPDDCKNYSDAKYLKADPPLQEVVRVAKLNNVDLDVKPTQDEEDNGFLYKHLLMHNTFRKLRGRSNLRQKILFTERNAEDENGADDESPVVYTRQQAKTAALAEQLQQQQQQLQQLQQQQA